MDRESGPHWFLIVGDKPPSEAQARDSADEPPRHEVKLDTIDPIVPEECVGCLDRNVTIHRRLVFRRSDGTVERVSAVHWPYCRPCHASLQKLDKQQRLMTWAGAVQMLLVVYIVGAALDWYSLWRPSMGLLFLFFVLFVIFAKRARSLWILEWARIDDVYKGGRGAAYSFRNPETAQRFLAANAGHKI